MTDSDVAATEGRSVTELIALGRDREAAVLAEARDQGGPMDVLTQLEQMGPAVAGVVGGITPDQLDNPTPCANFTVRGILEHMVGGAAVFTAAFRGTEPGEADLENVLDSFGPALGELLEAMSAPGAMDKTIAAPFGEVSGDTFARFVALDGLVHGWDLATATGQPYAPTAEVVAEAEAFAKATLDGLRDGDTFKAATEPPASATPIERLAAYTGRQV